MNWLPLKSLIFTLPLVAWASTSTADYSPNELALDTCEGVLQSGSTGSNSAQCREFISEYLNDLTSEASVEKTEDLAADLQDSSVLAGLEQRAADTRAGGYMDRLNELAAERACSIEKQERTALVTQLADGLGYSGEQTRELIDSVHNILVREGTC